EMIANVFDLRLAAQTRFLPIGQHFFKQMPVLLLLSSGINQTRVRRRILRFKILDRLKISSVGNDLGEFFELIELAQLGSSFFLFSDSSAHDFSSSNNRALAARGTVSVSLQSRMDNRKCRLR